MEYRAFSRNAIMAIAAIAFIAFGLQFVLSSDPQNESADGAESKEEEVHDCDEQGEGENLVKGSMTLAEVSQVSGICLSHFRADLGLPENFDYDTPIRDIKTRYGIEVHTSDIKDYVEGFTHDEGEDVIEYDVLNDDRLVCPFGLHFDPYPGRCGIFQDEDSDRICDLSQ